MTILEQLVQLRTERDALFEMLDEGRELVIRWSLPEKPAWSLAEWERRAENLLAACKQRG